MSTGPPNASAITSPRVVALGGGTGLPTVLSAVRSIVRAGAPPSVITAIVSVTDDGGSSGELRRQFGILPPGDVRNCVAALTANTSLVRLLQHRFSDGEGLAGHAVGNLILTALTEQLGGDFPTAVEMFSRLAGVGGRVLPVTADNVHLRAEYACGEVAVGETAIVARRLPIRRLSLDRRVRPLPEVIEALVNADVIIVGPGSLYTSLLPVLMVDGVAATIFGVRATKILVANLMTEPGETDGFTLDDHLRVIRDHTGYDLFDFVLANQQPLNPSAASKYRECGSVPIEATNHVFHGGAAQIVGCDLTVEGCGPKIRHEPQALGQALQEVVARHTPHLGTPADSRLEHIA